jgi:hypothetical protein
METQNFVTTPAGIQKLAQALMAADAGANQGRATYLRSLLASTQEAIIGKPVLRVSGRAKRPDMDQALATYEKVQETFYAAVLAAVPEGLTAQERQSKTSFARSSGATLRRAIRTGWNPLATSVSAVSKGILTAWIAEHREHRDITPARAEKQVTGLVERISELLAGLPKDEAARIAAQAAADLSPETAPQRITGGRLVKHERRAPH